MKEQSQIRECVGKTVSAVEHECGGCGILIAFTDGCFCYLNASTGYEDEPILNQETFNTVSNGLGDSTVIRLGIATQEELNNIRTAKLEEARMHERRWYLQLRAKYENER